MLSQERAVVNAENLSGFRRHSVIFLTFSNIIHKTRNLTYDSAKEEYEL